MKVVESDFGIQYMFSMILCSLFENLISTQSLDMLESVQNHLLANSVQILWHMVQVITSKISEQRTLSIRILSAMFTKNLNTKDVLNRMLPAKLLSKRILFPRDVERQFQSYINFFTEDFLNTFETPEEQWHFRTRRELTLKLREEIRHFIQQRDKGADESIQLIVKKKDEVQRPTFNYQEFYVDYECLDEMYSVGDYFITPLLVLDLEQSPKLATRIKSPINFWSELMSRFMTSYDMNEQRKIIMTMCLIYKDHFKDIGEMKQIPYLLQLIELPDFHHC